MLCPRKPMGQPFPFAIYADEQPVGFVMITYRITGYELPTIADDSYCILRLMIDQQFQNRGYGREAMKKSWNLSVPFLRGLHITAGFLIRLISRQKLYESYGFRDNGEIENDELITVIRL